MVIWDETGRSSGWPEKIEAELNDGLISREKEEIEANAPTVFPNFETAISWGYEQGAFDSLEAALKGYDCIKERDSPLTAQVMASLWVTEMSALKNKR